MYKAGKVFYRDPTGPLSSSQHVSSQASVEANSSSTITKDAATTSLSANTTQAPECSRGYNFPMVVVLIQEVMKYQMFGSKASLRL